MLFFWKRYLFGLVSLLLAGSLPSYAAVQRGTVQSGEVPIAFSTVALYRTGEFSPVILGVTRTDARGSFAIDVRGQNDRKGILYLLADGGAPISKPLGSNERSIRLATVLGTDVVSAGVVVNERTTVATAYAMAQFIDDGRIAGKSPGLPNAAGTLQNLVDVTTGGVGAVLGSVPNGFETTTMSEFNSLANLLATCVDGGSCTSLFNLAKPARGGAPKDTLQAAVNIAHAPGKNASDIFQQSQMATKYLPDLSAAPDAWTLAIRYNGNGHEFDGPGNIGFDADGNAWITNNYVFDPNPLNPVCGGLQVVKLTPTGSDAPGAPYSGGGLYGVGWGVAVEPDGNAWLGNFGFQGKGCTQTFAGSMSKFRDDGVALTPADGITTGKISNPQGLALDRQSNLWIANCSGNSVTKYAGGNPNAARNFDDVGLLRPFGMAVDGDGNAWVSSSGNDEVVGLNPRGEPLPGSPFKDGGIKSPLGMAVDSRGNVWVANSGIVQLPCAFTGGLDMGVPSVTMIRRNGKQVSLKSFRGGGLLVAWGIAVDGDDNIWVSNFGGKRVTEFCGANPSKCPPGLQTGDPISPDSGYSFDGLERNTAMTIDPSGNVWVANNWLTAAVQTNPGGHEVVVFVGLAAPVKTPMAGPPRQP